MNKFLTILILLILLIPAVIPAEAQTKLNIVAPELQLNAELLTKDPLEMVNTSYQFQDESDANSKFKEVRYMLQKDDMYVAYNNETQNVEIGLFACY